MWFELLILILISGIVFGYLLKGREDLMGLLKQGVIIGILLAVIFMMIAIFLAPGEIALATGFLGGLVILIEFISFVFIFILGVYIGDFIEGRMKK
jgi:hypothetical protein